MTGMLPPGAPEFRERFSTFRHSVFRLETLQHYEGDESLAWFIAGKREPADPHHDAWCEHIAANVQAGKTVQRVHVVHEPLSDYMRCELTWGYAPNTRAGEDIRIISVPANQSWPRDIPQLDYWLFDDVDLYRMHYSREGILSGLELIGDRAVVDAARAAKDNALRLGVPWRTYLSARPDLARHLELARTS